MPTVSAEKALLRERAQSIRDQMHGQRAEPQDSPGHSRRGLGAPVRRTFVMATQGRSPLVDLISGGDAPRGGGGRGGRTRLVLELTLLWVLAGQNHASNRPARVWAELTGVKDPSRNGARVIRDALAGLASRNLVQITPPAEPGHAPTITLRHESGDGTAYSIPSGGQDDYFRVPETLWTNGIVHDISGPGLAVYLTMLSVHRSDDPERLMWFTPATYRGLFGLSESTRKAGLRNLIDNDVLWKQRQSIDSSGGRDGQTRSRNVYKFNPQFGPRSAPAAG